MNLKLYITLTTVLFCVLCISLDGFQDQGTLTETGMNVCIKKRVIVRYITTAQSFAEPVYKPYLRPCSQWGTALCSSYQTFYKRSFRQVKLSRLEEETYHDCCPGWARKNENSEDCNIAVCDKPCKNDGECTNPNSCTCKQGWTGNDCADDINECDYDNGGCSQICINTKGSYNCKCNHGFIAEGKSCVVCVTCTKDWKNMEERVRFLEKELLILTKRITSYGGMQMLIHGIQKQRNSLRGPPGPKGEKGETGPEGTPGPPAEVLGSVIGRLAHFEEYIKECQCIEKTKKDERDITPDITDSGDLIATTMG